MPIISAALAHEEGQIVEVAQTTIPEIIRSNQINFTLATAAILVILTVLAILLSRKKQSPLVAVPANVAPPTQSAQTDGTSGIPASVEPTQANPAPESENAWWKLPLFLGIVLVTLTNTFYLVGSTLYVNLKSASKGPIHWHTDFEVWDCGKEIELVDPKLPSNKVGSPLLHEHNDKEIHVEEAFFDKRNVSLGAFFIVVGGDLHSDSLKFPTNDGIVERKNGDLCPDGQPGTLQAFLYKQSFSSNKAGSFNQQKLPNPQDYIMTAEQKVPPGDCVIFEFGPLMEKTDHLCQSYQVAKEKQSRGR